MPSDKTVVVLHGMTMCGDSMLRSLGPLRPAFEDAGFELIAPDGAHQMSVEEVMGLQRFVEPKYAELNQRAGETFRDGKFWNPGDHHDWFRVTGDEAGRKVYGALEQSIEIVAEAVAMRAPVGLVGFSQGAAMGVILAALASQDDPRFSALRFGIFLGGFKPEFDVPPVVRYPIAGDFRRLLMIGDCDPLFRGGQTQLDALGAAFRGGAETSRVVAGFGHDIPTDSDSVEQIIGFARAGVV